MKTFLIMAAAATTLAFMAQGAHAYNQAPGTGLMGTAHDFASHTGNRIPNTASRDIGLCEYCHTMHVGRTTELIWNHTLSKTNFAWDVASTTAGTKFPTISGPTYKGPTAKCMSCHDGSVAVGDVAWFADGGRGGPAVLSTWRMGDTDGNGKNTAQFVVGAGGSMAGNHPVAMPYSYGQVSNSYNGQAGGPGLVRADWQPNPGGLSSSRIQLFNDDGTGAIGRGAVPGRTGIECSSCHDPHNKETMDKWFLRAKATGTTAADGYICLQCHVM